MAASELPIHLLHLAAIPYLARAFILSNFLYISHFLSHFHQLTSVLCFMLWMAWLVPLILHLGARARELRRERGCALSTHSARLVTRVLATHADHLVRSRRSRRAFAPQLALLAYDSCRPTSRLCPIGAST